MKEFISVYNEWRNGHGRNFVLKPVESNELFAELRKPFSRRSDKDFIDYNYLVDDILQISPPYQ
jgi:hypothetical protein